MNCFPSAEVNSRTEWKKDGLELYDLGKINREQLEQSTNYTYGIMQRENERIN